MSEIKVNSIKGTGASSAAITVHTSDGTATGKFTNLPGRNIVINGAMNIAQYGTSATATGFKTVDRWKFNGDWPGNAITTAQSDVAAGTTPYEKGFRKAWKVTNVSQSSAGASNFMHIDTKLEAQDIVTSGWNYTSASSKITLSFWVKSSVAQTFYGYLYTSDGTEQQYPFSFALSANTWTKVTKTIPGHANLTVDNNVNEGLRITIAQFYGTTYTASGVTLDAWGAYSGTANLPDNTSTWFTTNAATFELTGVQLEVGDVATEFEHKRFNDDLRACQRYYCKTYAHATAPGTDTWANMHGRQSDGGSNSYAGPGVWYYPGGEMRAVPTVTLYSKDGDTGKINIDNAEGDGTVPAGNQGTKGCIAYRNNDSTGSTGAGSNIAFHATATAEI